MRENTLSSLSGQYLAPIKYSMNKLLPLFLLGSVLFFVSCSKSHENRCLTTIDVAADTTEVKNLKAYLDARGIKATADPRGFFYIINNPGDTTLRPSVCSTIATSYTGRLTDGNQFDASNYTTLSLSNLVLGWQEGLPLIGKGGNITLYVPPSLGYGTIARSTIPANSTLVFYIDLLNVL